MEEIIGFIGIGTMGKPMSLNLLKAGYRLNVYDLNAMALEELKTKGAMVCHSSKEVASKSNTIITMLPNSEDVEKVILGENGVAEGANKECIVIDMSTIDPATSQKIANDLSKRNIKMLDAPVSGGSWGAASGSLAIMVGGEEQVFERCLKIFQNMGKKIFYCGPNGNGEIVKIMNNLLAGINILATGEALSLGVKAGVNLRVLYDVINASSGQNFAMQNYCSNKAFKGDYEPGFMASLMHKDMGLAMALAKNEGVPLLIGGLGHQMYSNIVAAGYGRKDMSIFLKILEDLKNIKMRF